MKPLFIFLLLVSSLLAKNSYASDIVSAKALKSFQTTFTTAKDAEWVVIDKYYKVQFMMNEQTVTAFYNIEGNLLAVTRNISSAQLPLMLLAELKSRSCNQWISDLVEMSNDSGTDYYVTLENADTKTVLKSSNNSNWVLYKKIKKS
jgi:hypothetical protein